MLAALSKLLLLLLDLDNRVSIETFYFRQLGEGGL